MGIETQAPGWQWYFIALYFFVAGVSAGAFFIGSLIELFGAEQYRGLSRVAYYVAFPLILLAPPLLIGDLGQPGRFWHLFFYPGRLSFNLQSPVSVGSWALLVYGAFAFLAFLDNLVETGHLKFAPFAKLYNRVPRKLYAVAGSFMGFFVAGYTGVLLNLTARPLWQATDPLLGMLFIVSAGSTGAAAIALAMVAIPTGSQASPAGTRARQQVAGAPYAQLEGYDRLAMIVEVVLIAVVVIVAGPFGAPLISGAVAPLFWVGVVVLGLLVPLGLNLYASRRGQAPLSLAVLAALLVLLGGAFLRISLVAAGQV